MLTLEKFQPLYRFLRKNNEIVLDFRAFLIAVLKQDPMPMKIEACVIADNSVLGSMDNNAPLE